LAFVRLCFPFETRDIWRILAEEKDKLLLMELLSCWSEHTVIVQVSNEKDNLGNK
jgi:hypothetical protein